MSGEDYGAPLPDDLGHPRRDYSGLGGVIGGGVLFALGVALLVVALNVG